MDKKKKRNRNPDSRHVDYPAMTSTVSCTETTGLMAAPPQSPEEYESLLDNAPTETPPLQGSEKVLNP